MEEKKEREGKGKEKKERRGRREGRREEKQCFFFYEKKGYVYLTLPSPFSPSSPFLLLLSFSLSLSSPIATNSDHKCQLTAAN
jgi:hypothetical protein